MKKQRKVIVISLAVAAALFAVYIMLPFFPWNRQKSFDGKELMRIGTSEARHNFSAIIDKAMAKFSDLYWVYGFKNPFLRPDHVNLINFYADIRKEEQGYSIREIMMDVQYPQGQFLYTQQINIRPGWVHSNISRQSREGLVVFQDAPSVGTFLDKLDRLDFQRVSALLPECDGHMINGMNLADVIARSNPGGIMRYLVNDDGSIEKSGEDADTPIGLKVPVIMINAAYENENTYGGDEIIVLYLNN